MIEKHPAPDRLSERWRKEVQYPAPDRLSERWKYSKRRMVAPPDVQLREAQVSASERREIEKGASDRSSEVRCTQGKNVRKARMIN